MILPQFFLEFGELKIATNCTIKHSYTDWNQWGNTTEYWRLLCLPRQICRFSKMAAQSQVISLHELCRQDFLFSFIFERVRSRSPRQKKNNLRGWLVYIAHKHRTPNVLIDCSQTPIFSCDRWDTARLLMTAILVFKCTEGAGVGDYSSSQTAPCPLSSFDTHARCSPKRKALDLDDLTEK